MDLFSYLEEEEKQKKILHPKAVKDEETMPIESKSLTGTKTDVIYSVFEISKLIKDLLENNLPEIWIEGEISNYKKHSSGHHYFSLKDEKSVISCVMWRSVRFAGNLDNGQKVKILGKVTVYEGSGKYQIDVRKIELSGVGELQLKFEMLKQKLLTEGLFEKSHKKPIPSFILNLGVITAETGAAFQDIRKVVHGRAPFVNIVLYNAKVQGEGAAAEIAAGIIAFNNQPDPVDVIICGRGGGSLEDLWPFNEEIVARAIYDSKIPIISAVGHEIDFSISDFTADVRAATPSHAAEIATIDINEQNLFLKQIKLRSENYINKYFQRQHDNLLRIENSYAFRRPADIFKNYTMHLDGLEDKLEMLFKSRIEREKNKINNLYNLLRTLGPDSVLQRGYAIINNETQNTVVDSVQKTISGDILKIRLKDGEIKGQVQ